jgi:hypothetical protein
MSSAYHNWKKRAIEAEDRLKAAGKAWPMIKRLAGDRLRRDNALVEKMDRALTGDSPEGVRAPKEPEGSEPDYDALLDEAYAHDDNAERLSRIGRVDAEHKNRASPDKNAAPSNPEGSDTTTQNEPMTPQTADEAAAPSSPEGSECPTCASGDDCPTHAEET